MWMWTELIWFKLGTSGSEHLNEPFSSVKSWGFLDSLSNY
jgi:hypothetical protein